jgi:peptidyl-tRNA hydrolase
MSAGKIAAQSFQAAQRLFAAAENNGELAALLETWQAAGTCTRTRVALSSFVFDRACRELPGALMIDEGVTEVEPGSVTCFATHPLDERRLPRILRHKRVPVLNAPVEHISNPAREAEMDQHRPSADGINGAQVSSVGWAEVVGSMPASGLAHAATSPGHSSPGDRGPWGGRVHSPLSPPTIS